MGCEAPSVFLNVLLSVLLQVLDLDSEEEDGTQVEDFTANEATLRSRSLPGSKGTIHALRQMPDFTIKHTHTT
jgi:hypothetical protein